MRPEDRYDSLFQFYGWKSGVDWLLLKAQVKAESDFNPDAESKVGAKGLAQFMAQTWKEWRDGTAGIEEEPPSMGTVPARGAQEGGQSPFDPEDAIRAQAAYMAWLLKQVDGDRREALACYNWGVGNVRKLISTEGVGWAAHLPEETKNYVARIDANYNRYRKERGQVHAA